MTKKEIPVWEKATLTIDETAAYTGIGGKLIRALAHASLNERSDFPAFRIGVTVKIPRLALLKWLEDVSTSHRDIKRAAEMVENAEQMSEARGRGRPRKRREAVA